MDVHALQIFVEVAQCQSFSEVARRRRVEPSSVSRSVALIEGELGERLFHRTTRKLSLTEAGALYLARIEPLVMQLDDARLEVKSVGRSPTGTVRLSASVAFGQLCIVPLLGAFAQRYPGLVLELLLSDANTDLVGDQIDLAVRLAPGIQTNVIVSKLFDTRYRVVASPDWLAANPLAAPDDLKRHSVLRFTLAGFRDRWLFRDAGGDVSAVPLEGRFLVSSALALREAALAGLGPALLADWMTEDDRIAGRLVDCFPTLRATATEFDTAAWLIYPSRSFLPAKVRVVIDFLREHLSASRGHRSHVDKSPD